MKKEDGFFLNKQTKIKYIEPEICPKCLMKFVPTKQSMKECLFCKRGKVFIRKVNIF